ncbi:hypothetical protein [Umezawaea sp.]|uniref:hypothetical protein n=1 Tax=Umezawaea sp. TaxID=1955258 RepID=UPI002ED34425
MKRRGKAVLAVALAVAGLTTAVTGTAAAAGCTWTRGALPLPAGSTRGYVTGAANGGWFVGSGSTTDAVRWHGGQVENLGQALGRQTQLTDVNSSGVAVGYTYVETFRDGAFVHRGGRFERLPTPSGYRTSWGKAINDAGDVVGMASGIGDTFDLVLWPAATPGTPVVVNPDPALYSYVSPIDVDEQGRILLFAEGAETAHFVRHPDGALTRLAVRTTYVDAFRNGRVSGELYENRAYTTVEWDLDGQVVRRLGVRATETVVDSGTLTVGTYRTADKGYALGVWDGGVLADTLVANQDGTFGRPVITDDGVVAVHDDSAGTITTFTRACS